MPGRFLIHFSVLALCLFLCTDLAHSENGHLAPALVERGDEAWKVRGKARDGEFASPEHNNEAMRRYREALEQDSISVFSIEARWKLLRALHYAIDFTNSDDATKNRHRAEAVELARTSRKDLESGLGSEHDRARLYFWSAIAWGTRAQSVGLLTLVREGVASRIHENAMQSLALDPNVDDGGALRLLASLHANLPRVPFISGWVDRDKALPFAERAQALAPKHPGNQLVLALTLLDRNPERREEARQLLINLGETRPRPGFPVEDQAIKKQARQELAELDD